MYKKILIATDGSELAGRALKHGLHLARSQGAKVLIVTVTETWSPLDVAAEADLGNFDALQQFEKSAKQSADAILQRAAESAADIGVAAETRHVENSKPAEGILDTAESEACDLIVMASHGRRGFQKMLLGSQTYEVISLSTRPVLVWR